MAQTNQPIFFGTFRAFEHRTDYVLGYSLAHHHHLIHLSPLTHSLYSLVRSTPSHHVALPHGRGPRCLSSCPAYVKRRPSGCQVLVRLLCAGNASVSNPEAPRRISPGSYGTAAACPLARPHGRPSASRAPGRSAPPCSPPPSRALLPPDLPLPLPRHRHKPRNGPSPRRTPNR